MTTDTRIETVIHRLRLGRRIAELMQTGAPMNLIRAAWRVFCRLARATMIVPADAFAQVQ